MACSLYYTQNAIKKVLLEKHEESLSSPSETTSVKYQGCQKRQEEYSRGNTSQLAWEMEDI